MGNDGYALIRDLCIPQKPCEKRYVELKEMLSNYMNPKPNHITERYKFKERKQASNESIMQFVTNLKKMTEYYEFGTSLDDCLRDQMIWGVKDNNIKKRLLSENKLTFKKCVELSVALESANRDVIKLDSEKVNYQGISTKKRNHFNKKGKKSMVRTESSKIICYCCGAVGHMKPFCKYKDYKCKKCCKVGHLQKVCKAKVKTVNNLEDELMDLNLNSLFNLDTVSVNYVKPHCIELYVNNKDLEFQFDTGTGASYQKRNLNSIRLVILKMYVRLMLP